MRISCEDGSAHADASALPAPPLELQVQEADPKRRRNGQPKGARKPKATTPGHAEVMAHYAEAFERRRGVKPVLGGAEGTAVKTLLGKLNGDVERAKQIITNALESWKGDTVTILGIARDPSAFAAPAPAKPNGQRRHQPNAAELPDFLRSDAQ